MKKPFDPGFTAIEQTPHAAATGSNKPRTDAPHERKINIFSVQKAQDNSNTLQKPLCFGCKQ